MTELAGDAPRSPGHMRMSLAAAMTLGYKPGLFYRDARLYCINLLLTYPGGCGARCAYCGLSAERPKTDEGKSFVRVQWPTFPAAVQVTPAAYQAHPSAVLTVCNVVRNGTGGGRNLRYKCSGFWA